MLEQDPVLPLHAAASTEIPTSLVDTSFASRMYASTSSAFNTTVGNASGFVATSYVEPPAYKLVKFEYDNLQWPVDTAIPQFPLAPEQGKPMDMSTPAVGHPANLAWVGDAYTCNSHWTRTV